MKKIIENAIRSYRDELLATIIYAKLASLYKSETLRKKLTKISNMEKRHAEFWRRFLERRGVNVDHYSSISKIKLSILKILARILGQALLLRVLELSEREAVEMYSLMLESSELNNEEKEALRNILEDELIHEFELSEESSRFKEFIEHVRDAVLGMSDGLVEILSVSAGLAGAYGNPFYVAIGGAIVGVAGALSMGIGAFTSVRAQKQVRMSILERVRIASKYVAHVFVKRLMNTLVDRGISRESAEKLAKEASEKPELLGRIVAEEEYGLTEEALENPVRAGFYTGIFYMIGALVPLIPYFLGLSIGVAIPLSFIFAALMLGLTGFMIAVTANLDYRIKMIELITAGLGAASLTFLVGKAASMLLGIELE